MLREDEAETPVRMDLEELDLVINGAERLDSKSELLTSSLNYGRLLDDNRTYYFEQESSDGVNGILKRSSEIIPSTVTQETLWKFVLDVQPEKVGNFGMNDTPRRQYPNNFMIMDLFECLSSNGIHDE